jgi:hypothetical protein
MPKKQPRNISVRHCSTLFVSAPKATINTLSNQAFGQPINSCDGVSCTQALQQALLLYNNPGTADGLK